MIIVHYAVKTDPVRGTAASVRLERKVLDPAEPIPPGAVWIDMVDPTLDEDRKVEAYLGCKVPSRSDPDFAEPPESYYAENGVRYLPPSVVSEAESSPDVIDVTFVLAPESAGHRALRSRRRLRTLRPEARQDSGPGASSRRGGGRPRQRHRRSLGAGLEQGRRRARFDRAAACFGPRATLRTRSTVYSDTLDALGREDEKISNLRESLVEIERLLLFLSSEGRSADAPKPVREATKAALRDLQSLEEDASFKAQKVQFLLDATLGFINLAQNDIIKLFSVLAVIFMPPTMIASIYGMNFKAMPELDWWWGYPAALVLMVLVGVGPYVFFRWKKWL